MRYILGLISKQFLIGDVGVTGTNYLNWGVRNDGTICILDFAYIYSVKYNIFGCNCSDEAILQYDKNYVKLICPICGRLYTFGEVRRKITKKQQEEEIGDIRRLGYNLIDKEEYKEYNPDFEPKKKDKKKKKKKKLTENEKLIRDYRNGDLKPKQDWDYPDQNI